MYYLTYEIPSDRGYGHFCVTGTIDRDHVIPMFEEIVTQCKASNINKILLNVKELELNFQGLALVENLHRLEPILSGFKMARLVKHIDVNSGLIDSYSEQNKVDIRNFENEKEATQWLLS